MSSIAKAIGEHPNYYKGDEDAAELEAADCAESDMRDHRMVAKCFHGEPVALAKALAALWGPTAPTGTVRQILLETALSELQEYCYEILYADNLDRIRDEIRWGC
jgi:hypothetical protein